MECSLGGHERRPHENHGGILQRFKVFSAHPAIYDRVNALATAHFLVFLFLTFVIPAQSAFSSFLNKKLRFFLTQINDTTRSLTIRSLLSLNASKPNLFDCNCSKSYYIAESDFSFSVRCKRKKCSILRLNPGATSHCLSNHRSCTMAVVKYIYETGLFKLYSGKHGLSESQSRDPRLQKG